MRSVYRTIYVGYNVSQGVFNAAEFMKAALQARLSGEPQPCVDSGSHQEECTMCKCIIHSLNLSPTSKTNFPGLGTMS